jgi:hypothetical protein
MFLIITLPFFKIIAPACSCFVITSCHGQESQSFWMTYILPPLNTSFYSYTVYQGTALSPYWAHKCVWISTPLIQGWAGRCDIFGMDIKVGVGD